MLEMAFPILLLPSSLLLPPSLPLDICLLSRQGSTATSLLSAIALVPSPAHTHLIYSSPCFPNMVHFPLTALTSHCFMMVTVPYPIIQRNLTHFPLCPPTITAFVVDIVIVLFYLGITEFPRPSNLVRKYIGLANDSGGHDTGIHSASCGGHLPIQLMVASGGRRDV